MTMKRRSFLLASSSLAGGLISSNARAATPCPPPVVSTSAGSVTSPSCGISGANLTTLAASMSPGTWAQLNAAGLNVLGVLGSQGGVGGNMIPYSNQAVWCPITKAIRYCGSDHHGGAAGFSVMEVQYLASN